MRSIFLTSLLAGLGTAFSFADKLVPRATGPLEPRATGPLPDNAYPDPLPCSGNCSAYEDQSIVRRVSDGLLHRFAFSSTTGNAVMLTSKHLKGPWTFVTPQVLPKTPKSPFGPRDATWNPDVHYVNGQYLLFYTDHHVGSQPPPGSEPANVTISWATSPNMNPGTWTDHGPIGILEEGRVHYSRIGGNLLPTSNPPQLVWGSDRWGIYAANLTFSTNPYNISLKPPAASHYNQLIAAEVIKGSPRNLTEGAFQYQHPTNGYYYIFFSVGVNYPADGSPYNRRFRIEVCRSKNPYYGFQGMVGGKIISCLDRGNHPTGHIVIQSHGEHVLGPGSPGVIDDPEEGITLYYQYTDPTGPTKPSYNKHFGYNHLSFDSGWPVLVA